MRVKLYSTGCPMCKVLKSKLDAKGVLYDYIEDINVMMSKGFLSAPQLEIDDTVLDFNSARKLIDEFDGTTDIITFAKSQITE